MRKVGLKMPGLVIIGLLFITIVFISTSWIIQPTATALIQGDDWISVCKGVIELQLNRSVVVQINDKPVSYLEKEDGMLERYLKQNDYEINTYYPEFMICEYTDKEGNIVQLKGRKCGSKYTIWKHR